MCVPALLCVVEVYFKQGALNVENIVISSVILMYGQYRIL